VETGKLPSATESYLTEPVNAFISNLPKGFYVEQSGQAESRNQSQSQIYSSALLYLILIIGGLVFALNSFRQTALILSVGGLCIGLSYLGLTIGNQNYGFIATIGAVGLVGLSINDSIIVLSHIKEEAEKRLITKAEITEIVIRSTRHIITTSVTTIGGFAPLIFSSVFFRPLAWAMTIGVLGATLLALLYIPAMFMFMNKIKS
jgi:multidrug efflux pump subunit AcrB